MLAIYPEQQVAVAMVANLGHAKLPFARLMGVVNPFLADPAPWAMGALAVALAGVGVAHRRRHRGQARLPH